MNYYISNTGNNSNNGTSEGTAWANVSKINSSSFNPGDQILFNRGDVFRGGIIMPSSGSSSNPIVISNYGVGAKPIISGMEDVTSWTSIGSNKYTATVAGPNRINILTIDGTQRWMGRYPTTGWNTISNFVYGSTSTVTGNIPSSPNFNGGEVVIKKTEWVIDRHPIASHSGANITYTETTPNYIQSCPTPGNGSCGLGMGYFVQNHINTLTTQGDWQYNPTTDVLTMYSTSTPSSVKVATLDYLLTNNGKNYITIDGLVFTGANIDCAYIDSGASNNIIQNCDFTFAGLHHIDTTGTTNLTVQFNNFNNANNQAIHSISGSNTSILSNVVYYIGMYAGAGANNNEANNGMRIAGSNCIIDRNTVSYVGYCGINPTGQNMLVKRNYIHHYCMLATDGGGIYNGGADTSAGKIFEDNFCIYGYGDISGTPFGAGSNACFGIYCDEADANVTIRRNTCAFNGYGSGGGGIYLHKAYNIDITNNILYGNYKSQLKVSQDLPKAEFNGGNLQPIRNIVFTNNVVYSTSNDHYLYWLWSTPPPDDDIPDFFSSINNNILARPTGGTSLIHTFEWGTYIEHDYTLAQWKSTFSPYDAASTAAPIEFGTPRFEFNETGVNKVVSLNGVYKDIYGSNYTNSITLSPYTSNILTRVSDGPMGSIPVIGIKVLLV